MAIIDPNMPNNLPFLNMDPEARTALIREMWASGQIKGPGTGPDMSDSFFELLSVPVAIVGGVLEGVASLLDW